MPLTMSASVFRQQHISPWSSTLMLGLIVVVLLQLTLFSVTSAAPAAVHPDEEASESRAAESNVAPRIRRELIDKRGRASWGKRESTGTDGVFPAPGELGNDELQTSDADKRGRASWGKKRIVGNAARPQFADSKATRSKWSDGDFSVWGKRSATGNDVVEEDDEEDDKKRDSKWSLGTPALWGKREDEILRGWQNKDNLAVWG